ncbi:hypothetical protein E4U42_004404 [Claviceps africana]|uniref:RING-type domain-containing protein n=1 Tax=Claviceps africana TaxID=83212 RepID=A0A8K0J5R1_9HYPO|nr:hypothetical protein E4U42_004404 [Claviceps africana]
MWGEDTIAHHTSSFGNTTSQLDPEDQDDDDFLSVFADHHFSSPSSYSPFTANLSADGASPRRQAALPFHQATAAAAVLAASSPRLRLPRGISPSPLNKRQPPLDSDASLSLSLSNAMMDPSQEPQALDDGLFEDGLFLHDHLDHDKDLATIDLTEATDVPEDLKKPPSVDSKQDNKIKISKFQCVICMDDASNLTVTHCATKNKCPMCRAKIDVKSRASYSTKTKGFWPLELKLMTATRKGKRKADNIS